MVKKIKLTRPELKRYREALSRYERYLPMLKLKQQRLQVVLRDVDRRRREALLKREAIEETIRRYEAVRADLAGAPIDEWSQPSEVRTHEKNVAGVPVPEFEGVDFPEASYSLFATPPWVDRTLEDFRERSRRRAVVDVLTQQEEIVRRELSRIIQRVNLFEKIMIPDAIEAIRRIRIKLGDEMTDAVGRSKIAKKKLSQSMEPTAPPSEEIDETEDADSPEDDEQREKEGGI